MVERRPSFRTFQATFQCRYEVRKKRILCKKALSTAQMITVLHSQRLCRPLHERRDELVPGGVMYFKFRWIEFPGFPDRGFDYGLQAFAKRRLLRGLRNDFCIVLGQGKSNRPDARDMQPRIRICWNSLKGVKVSVVVNVFNPIAPSL